MAYSISFRRQYKADHKATAKELLEQGRKEDKEVFLREIANTFDFHGVNAI